jgi:hypothetical protein
LSCASFDLIIYSRANERSFETALASYAMGDFGGYVTGDLGDFGDFGETASS